MRPIKQCKKLYANFIWKDISGCIISMNNRTDVTWNNCGQRFSQLCDMKCHIDIKIEISNHEEEHQQKFSNFGFDNKIILQKHVDK